MNEITVAGQTFTIPKLAIRQNRHVEPLAQKHADYFRHVQQAGGHINLLDLTEEQAADFTKIVYHALTRAKPDLTFAQFEEMPISMREIMLALPVCLQQSGLFKAAEEAATPGEAQSTGTTS